MDSKHHTVVGYGASAPDAWNAQLGAYRVELNHHSDDPAKVRRITVHATDCTVEIAPSKGLSLRSARFGGRDVFWELPLPSLPDPEQIDLAGSVWIAGNEHPGVAWVRYFAASIELLGLDHWGMHDRQGATLHGNASMVPVERVTCSEEDGVLEISGEFHIVDPVKVLPEPAHKPYYRITKTIRIDAAERTLYQCDRITNLSDVARTPDWGYHVQLRPESGSRFLVPARSTHPRRSPDERLPADADTWRPVADPGTRRERGYVHRDVLQAAAFPDGSPGVETLLLHPDGTGVACTIPPAPYTLSWFSAGGAHDPTFSVPTGPDGALEPVFERNWDGVGPEIGASALDADGDVDPAVVPKRLESGDSLDLQLLLRVVDAEDATRIGERILRHREAPESR